MKKKVKIYLLLSVCLRVNSSLAQCNGDDEKHNSILHSIETSKTIKLQLDSCIESLGEPRFASFWSYDKNKIIEEVFQIFGYERKPQSKKELLYDDRGLIQVEFNYDWQEDLGQYQPRRGAGNSKIEFFYDDHGNNTFKYNYGWEANKKTFVPFSKYEYIYDSTGCMTMSLTYFWEEELEYFILKHKYEYKCDEDGNIIESKWYRYYRNGLSVLTNKIIHTYSAEFDKQCTDYYSWNKDAQDMLLYANEETQYIFKKNKIFTLKNHTWGWSEINSKYDNKRVVYAPRFLRLSNNDIATALIDGPLEMRYDNYGICISVIHHLRNIVTDAVYIGEKSQRTILVDDERSLIYQYTNFVYDLDFYNWEKTSERVEYYSKIEK